MRLTQELKLCVRQLLGSRWTVCMPKGLALSVHTSLTVQINSRNQVALLLCIRRLLVEVGRQQFVYSRCMQLSRGWPLQLCMHSPPAVFCVWFRLRFSRFCPR